MTTSQCTDIVPTYMRVRTDTLVDTARAENDQIVNVVEITLWVFRTSVLAVSISFPCPDLILFLETDLGSKQVPKISRSCTTSAPDSFRWETWVLLLAVRVRIL